MIITDEHGSDESMTILEELEKIDDDCDKHGIQFVKIDDKKAAAEYNIPSIPAIVYFEKQEAHVYDGDLMDEEQILHWLVSQLEKDQIEDITEEVLDKWVKEGKVMAVLFCKTHLQNYTVSHSLLFVHLQTTIMIPVPKRCSANWRTLTTNVIRLALCL